ncbi:sensor histidine kinase [Solicola sp. PLA-1-18]|uniref:sensor histidine kinase n=1 Tax=Solicola sp. PLA-1-18 TaxID=3380532 RepID=UPI003B823A6B
MDARRTRRSARVAALLRGVRARSVLAVVVVMAIALGVGVAALVIVLIRTLNASAEENADARLDQVVRALGRSDVAAVGEQLRSDVVEGTVVQVVDDTGVVVAGSSGRAVRRPLTSLDPAVGQVLRTEVDRAVLLDPDAPYLFVVGAVRSQGETYRVVVASSLAPQREATGTVLLLLVVAFPVLLVMVAAATWVVVGRALSPVERIRSGVAAIEAANVRERVPVPETGDEVARLAVTMNEMLDRLERSQHSQRQFLSDASHELRSPLATLGATLEVVGPEPDPVDWQELRPVLVQETARMGVLVDNLLLLAKADDDGVGLQRVDVDLDDLVADERVRLGVQRAVEVRTHVRPARVVGDRNRLEQVLRNLVDNAVRHAAGTVAITCDEVDGYGRLVVEDDGPGIPDGERAHVLERFVRLDAGRDRDRGGSGLGLAIVDEIVRAHGGDVQIDASPLGGARVTARVPAAAFGDDAPDAQPPSAASR